MDGLEEKFTRCPQCRSFSIASMPPKIKSNLFSKFVKQYHVYHCRNCGHDFRQINTQDNRFLAHHEAALPKPSKRGGYLILGLVLIALLGYLLFNTGLFVSKSGGDAVTQPKEAPLPTLEAETQVVVEPSPASDHEPVEQDETSPVATDEAPPLPNPVEPVRESQALESEVVAGVIDLVGQARFGVNWERTVRGLQITRLSEGPLLLAGLKVGDLIVRLNDRPISSETPLMEFRTRLLKGQEKEGRLTVKRGEDELTFSMISSPSSSSEKPARSDSILVFKMTQLKTRSSNPVEESPNQRWVYGSKKVVLKRDADQKVFLSGTAETLSPWAVDNMILITKNAITGLIKPNTPEMTFIPKENYREPLDISDYFPMGESIEVTFSLVDLGVKWGNSDIYLIIK